MQCVAASDPSVADSTRPDEPTRLPPTTIRLKFIDTMRGLAAFSVCLFHFTGNHFLPDENLVTQACSFGFLGVQVFFVISGFVVPYALFARDYRIGDIGRFVGKRLLRLDPPYLACIVLIIGLNYLSSISPGYRGEPFHVDGRLLLAHLGYLNAFFDYSWFNDAFWTLAIEFQYYLIVGITYPFLASPRAWLRLSALFSLCLVGLLGHDSRLVVSWLSVFAVGIAVFQFRCGLLSRTAAAIAIPICLAAVCVSHGVLILAVSLLAGMAIIFADGLGKWSLWIPATRIGAISYSLYLLHVPIGSRVLHLVARFTDNVGWRLLCLAAATAISVVAAWLFFLIIEKPSRRLSSRLAYRREE